MRVLVTRPKADALSLKTTLEAAGHGVILAPMMTIAFKSPSIDLAGVQALLFTSANGVRAFAARSAERRLPAWAVGDATAAAARKAGFTDIHVSGGDAKALAHDVTAALRPADGALFHAAGSVVKKALGTDLEAAGFSYRKAIFYAAEPIGNFPEEAENALKNAEVDAILLYSPRTARLFAALAQKAGIDLEAADAYCLSDAVAAEAEVLSWRRIRVAERPDGNALLSLMSTPS